MSSELAPASADNRIPPPQFSVSALAYFGLFLMLFSGYLLSTSRERPWADATPVFQVAESIVNRGEFDIATAWPPTSPRGKDGKVYALAPLLQSLVHVPGAWLRKKALEIWPQQDAYFLPWASHLAPAALGALTCILFLGLCRREGVSLRISLILTLALAVGTSVWVYSRHGYSEILQGFCLLGFYAAFIAMCRRPTVARAIGFAVWAGLLVNAKPVFAPIMPGAAIYLAWTLRGNWRRLLLLAGVAMVVALPFAGLMLAYNRIRWGDPQNTGYGIAATIFSENLIFGLWGLFLSPGKSMLLYSPPLFLSVVGLGRFVRRQRLPAICLALTAIPPILVYSRFTFWSGDWAWGPRYLVPFISIMLLPAAQTLEAAASIAVKLWRRIASAAVAAVLVAGLCVQLLGIALYWDHFIRFSFEAGNLWLGIPNRAGSPAFIGGACGACFEEMHHYQWLPPFQPIKGQYWLLKHVWDNDPWPVAAADGPWLQYTDYTPNASTTYARARLDWWYRDYHDTYPDLGARLVEFLLLGTLLGTSACGFALWRTNRARRSGLPSPPVEPAVLHVDL